MQMTAKQARPQAMKKHKQATILMIIILLLCAIGLPTMAAAQAAKPVRVLMTAFGASQQLEIGIYGNYVLDQQLSFQRGSKLQVEQVGNRLQLHYEGMVYQAGNSLNLSRLLAAPDTENGLRLQNQLNLYPADLLVSADTQGLQVILTIPVEEYLQGVVPYEMADEFPLEALKAQAIAARTYTLAHMKPDKPYDLVDNTNDQVYRGTNIEKINAIKAVQETEGMVCLYGDQLANCYYTASNGGMTESAYNAWGRERIPYLTVQKDPYDVANPASIVKSARILKNFEGSLNQDSDLLKDYVEPLLSNVLVSRGLLKEGQGIQLLGITNIVAHTGKHAGTSGVQKNLRVDAQVQFDREQIASTDAEVSVSGQSTATGSETEKNTIQVVSSTPQEVSIDVPIFPDIEQLLGLSINRSENEVFSVTEDEANYYIQSRRYGHGVGMSQRGAEHMAGYHGWDYKQILQFYYPGTRLEARDTAWTPEAGMAQAYLTTPGPAPTATPRPTLMPMSIKPSASQRVARVSGIAENSSLNLRLKADYLADIVTRLYYGQLLLVINETEDGWLEVRTDDAEGFVRHEFVQDE